MGMQEDLEGLLALIDQDASGCIDYEVGQWKTSLPANAPGLSGGICY